MKIFYAIGAAILWTLTTAGALWIFFAVLFTAGLLEEIIKGNK
jgi:RsiW-degrading membrane proteinase PrsW (M82 family)